MVGLGTSTEVAAALARIEEAWVPSFVMERHASGLAHFGAVQAHPGSLCVPRAVTTHTASRRFCAPTRRILAHLFPQVGQGVHRIFEVSPPPLPFDPQRLLALDGL